MSRRVTIKTGYEDWTIKRLESKLNAVIPGLEDIEDNEAEAIARMLIEWSAR